MKKRSFLACVVGAIVSTVGWVGSGAVTEAGVTTTGTVTVDVSVRGADPATTLNGITAELFEQVSGTINLAANMCTMSTPTQTGPSPFTWDATFTCTNMPFGDYALGLDGIAGFAVNDGGCSTPGPVERLDLAGNENFTIDGSTRNISCFVDLWSSILLIDKTVNGGPATADDFVIEVYDSAGALVTSGSDPVSAVCDGTWEFSCGAIDLAPAAGYTLGEQAKYGYQMTSVGCDEFINAEGQLFGAGEKFADPAATFDHTEGDTYCGVTNTYREGRLVVTSSVTNDQGGVATPATVSIEVFQAVGGAQVVAATPCAPSGACLDMMLPIGDYVIGYVGPAGYTRSVTKTVEPILSERITDDPDAAFTIDSNVINRIAVAIDDPTPATTTTLAPTTTPAPTTTTLAPTTTALAAGAGTLPATGSGHANEMLALIAGLLVIAGGGLLAARRRPID